MAKSAQFRCPHCKTVLEKSGVAQLLGDSGGYVAFGPPTVPCPACGGALDTRKMIEGGYDVRENCLLGAIALLWMFGGPVLLATTFKWPILWAIVTPWASLLVIFGLFGFVMKRVRGTP